MKNGLLIALILLVAACAKKETSTESPTNFEGAVKLDQYMVEGQQLYVQYCANCHQSNGEGLGELYPPLAKSDYLQNSVDGAACIIKYGMSGSLTVNGVEYNQPMPGFKSLSPLEIAELITYITNSWGNDNGLTDVLAVESYLANCEK